MPEIAGNGAILVDPTVPIALADGLKSVLENRAVAQSLIQLGHDNASHFSWEKAADRYHDLFVRVLADC
jgi:glycosyltransferase involved in cell wall biosynthesis